MIRVPVKVPPLPPQLGTCCSVPSSTRDLCVCALRKVRFIVNSTSFRRGRLAGRAGHAPAGRRGCHRRGAQLLFGDLHWLSKSRLQGLGPVAPLCIVAAVGIRILGVAFKV